MKGHPVRIALLAATVLAIAAPAFVLHANEQPVELHPGPGLAELTANCQGCHSLDYVRMNAPFLTADVWKAEITKMRVAYGAAIDDEDSAKILAYLAASYGPAT